MVGWIGIATTSADATQASSSSGGTAGSDPEAAVEGRVGGAALELGLEDAVARAAPGPRRRDRRDRLDQLLDPAIAREAALVEHDARRRRASPSASWKRRGRGSGGSKR